MAPERTYLLSRLGRFDVLVEAGWVEEMGSGRDALASGLPVLDMAGRLDAEGDGERVAAKLVDRDRAGWLLLGPRAELHRVAAHDLRGMPRWARAASAPVLGVAVLAGRSQLAFELDLDRLLEELREENA